MIMKNATLSAVILAAALSVPVLASAQSTAPVTRAEVKAQLIQLEKVGYEPAQNDLNYPSNLQAAQRAVNNQTDASYGPSTAGSSSHSVRIAAPSDLYSHS
jgi:uncharacterized membrane protein